MVADCAKFTPNIFNSSKCATCFNSREEHGDVSLDCKSMRKPLKCGYLFIAPADWDFCNPSAHRTKRWQRRWFVLYNDDSLTWSIDEQPDTIPQGSLDMREILEVKNAEGITENPYSLALTGKQTTFIKGINNEDIKSWANFLTKYGAKMTTSNGKRSLTLPGGFGCSTNRFESSVVMGPSRPRYHSVANPPGVTSPLSPYGKSLLSPTRDSSNHDVDTTDSCKVDPPSETYTSKRSLYYPLSSSSTATISSKSSYQEQPLQHNLSLSSIRRRRQISSPTRVSSSTFLSKSSVPKCSSDTENINPSSDIPPTVDTSDENEYSPSHSVRALRGDPDGCGGLESNDGPTHKGWLMKRFGNEWPKYWFVLQNNVFIYYESSEESNPLGSIEISEETVIKQFESSKHYGFEVITNGQTHQLSAITNGMRGIWMKTLESSKSKCNHVQNESRSSVANPPSPPLKSKKSRWRKKSDIKLFENLKEDLKEREKDLESLECSTGKIVTSLSSNNNPSNDSPRVREILKSHSVQIDNFRTQLSSGFLELEKLKVYWKNRENEFNESVKCREDNLDQLRTELSQQRRFCEKLESEKRELEAQINILTDKLACHKNLLDSSERELHDGAMSRKEAEAVLKTRNAHLEGELSLLKARCNDLTDKLYRSERAARTMKSKLGRVKSQSLKDKQLELDVISKVSDLEEKIVKFEGKVGGSGPTSPLSPTSTKENTPVIKSSNPSPATTPCSASDSGITSAIMKLNDLDKRVERVVDSCWIQCGGLDGSSEVRDPTQNLGDCSNCKALEAALEDRDEKLCLMEENLKQLESDFKNKLLELRDLVKEMPGSDGSNSGTPSPVHNVSASVNKYQAEIEQLRSLCSKGLEAMEKSHRRMVIELEEKHRRELQNLKIEKENELAEETKATRAALDALKKNQKTELEREMEKFKEDFMRKVTGGQDLSDLHSEHEQELHDIKTEILQLTEKYSIKCLEASKLEETVNYLKSQLNDAKRKILDLEKNGFQSIISCAKKPDQVTALRSRLEHLILSRPIDDSKGGKEGQQQKSCSSTNFANCEMDGGGVSSCSGTNNKDITSSAKKTRHSIMRSPSCPKLNANTRFTVLQ